MSTETPPAEQQQSDPPAGPPAAPDKDASKEDKTDYKAEAEKWKALSRKNEADAKKLRAIEDAQKTELEKALEKATENEKRALAAERKAMRAEVAFEKKLPATLASRLQGDTLEEMRADADAILKDLAPAGNGGNGGGGGRPQENLQTLLTQGNGQTKQMPDMNAFMRSQLPGASGS